MDPAPQFPATIPAQISRVALLGRVTLLCLLMGAGMASIWAVDPKAVEFSAKKWTVTVRVKPSGDQPVTKEQVTAAEEILQLRLSRGRKDVLVSIVDGDTLRVETSGTVADIEAIRGTLEKAGKLEFRAAGSLDIQKLILERADNVRVMEPGYVELPKLETDARENSPPDTGAEQKLSRAEMAKQRIEGFYAKKQTIMVSNETLLSGKSIKAAYAQPEPGSGKYLITVRLRSEFGKKMEKISKKNLGQPMAIIVDNEVISAPIVQGVFGEDFQITGNFTQWQAAALASALSYPLDNPLEVIKIESKP